MMKLRKRTGFTLIEVLTVVTIMAAVFLGFTFLMYDMAEQMHISWQLREAEEYGTWYVNEFIEKVRNGYEPKLTRQEPPSELEVTFVASEEYSRPETYRDVDVWEFEFNYGRGLPQIRIDDQLHRYDFYRPDELGPRDEIFVSPNSFEIKKYDKLDLPRGQEFFREEYYTISFEITYVHYSSIPGRGIYTRVIPFSGSAYVINDNWPEIKPPAGFDDDDDDE